MKKKYLRPQAEIFVVSSERIIAKSKTNQDTHTDDPQDPEHALIKENSFDFSWE